jgi:hypothetical protein
LLSEIVTKTHTSEDSGDDDDHPPSWLSTAGTTQHKEEVKLSGATLQTHYLTSEATPERRRRRRTTRLGGGGLRALALESLSVAAASNST